MDRLFKRILGEGACDICILEYSFTLKECRDCHCLCCDEVRFYLSTVYFDAKAFLFTFSVFRLMSKIKSRVENLMFHVLEENAKVPFNCKRSSKSSKKLIIGENLTSI